MSLELYSTFLSVAVLALFLITLISILLYLVSPKHRISYSKVGYYTYIKLAGLVAIVSTLGALTYQFGYGTPVCEYCWWQRIFMFPIDIIALVTIWKQITYNEIVIMILAAIGSLFAAFHYYFHFQVAVLDNILSMPCSAVGIIPSCTETPVLIFGFITIPLMALVGFITILWLAFLAKKSR